MLPIQSETHWVYKTAQITRIGWFVIHLLILVIFLSASPFFWLLLPLFFAAFLIPQWSGIKADSFGVNHYPFLELTFSGLFLIVGCYFTGEYSSFLAYPALCAGIYSRPGKERWFLWSGFAVAPFLAVLAIGLNHIGMGVIDGLFFFGIGLAVAKVLEAEKKTQILLGENRRQNQLLEEYAKQIEKVTLLEERNRLAKDLHDTVGHTFTSVIMGLDAASFLIGTAPEKAQEQVDRLSDVMRRSLGELRTHIHQISPVGEQEELSAQLKKVTDQFVLHTKTEILFEHAGPQEINISSQGSITFVRCLQEALTNAVRHGHANKIVVILQEEAVCVSLTIKDNGIGMSSVKYGFGLNGMKERMESLQGGLTIESKPQAGTVVTCFLPVIASRLKGEAG
ncbi:sensor histidine kinase [Mesobacillus harenae]|uniref:sensor histidine kinase n=1 Tax=Mesobacillus harenae TaxID=2213203 RepID=UPI00158009A9|nr:sensor histidine kinase [Mesobacillus harenae]